MISNKEYKEIMFLERQLQGLSEYSDSQLRDVLIKKYGSEVVDKHEETVGLPGMVNSLKRAVGMGGYKTLQHVVMLADKIKKLDSDELVDFWMNFAQEKLSAMVGPEAVVLEEAVRRGFNHSRAPKKPEDREEIWNLAVSLCENIEEFEHAVPYGLRGNKDLRHAITGYVQQNWPDQFEKFRLAGDNGYTRGDRSIDFCCTKM